MVDTTDPHKADLDKAIEFLKNDISALRTGRANTAIVENIMVEAYGMMQQLKAVASITIPDARTIRIEPWDKSIVKDIEKGIVEAKTGLNPVVQGEMIRVPMPALTEETRKNLVKNLNEKLESARVTVRNVRDNVKHEIVTAEKEKEISEDDKYSMLEDLDKVCAGYNETIKNIGDEKEKEIMTI